MLAIKVVFYPLNNVNTGCLCTYVIVCNTSLNFTTLKFVFFPHYFKNFGLNWKTPSFHLKLISSINIKFFVIKYNVILIVINYIEHIRFLKCRFCLFKQNSEIKKICNIKFWHVIIFHHEKYGINRISCWYVHFKLKHYP